MPDDEAKTPPGGEPEEVAPAGDREPAEEEEGGRLGRSARRLDEAPGLVRAAKGMRELLPGDADVDNPLLDRPGGGSRALLRRLLGEDEKPSTARELGLAAVQVFQAMSESRARGQGERELSILFTDLVGFSDWALDAGDTAAVNLLREVADVVEPAIVDHEGEVVKRLGDGLMAVFTEASEAVEAALEAQAGVAGVTIDGHSPKLRAGVHVGQPRKVGRDYLGVDVNIAARVADAGGGDGVMVSSATRDALDPARFAFRRKRWFRAKGAPRDLEVYGVRAR